VRNVPCEPPGNEGRPLGECETDRVHRLLEDTGRRGHRGHEMVGRGRRLSGCQAVDLVVVRDDSEVDVPPNRVHVVPESDAVPVTVTHLDDDLLIGARECEPGGRRERSSVQGVHALDVVEVRSVAVAPDPPEHRELVLLPPQLSEGSFQGFIHAEVATTGAPRRTVRVGEVLGLGHHHTAPSESIAPAAVRVTGSPRCSLIFE